MRITSDFRRNDQLQLSAKVVVTDAVLGKPTELAIIDDSGVHVGILSISEELLSALTFELPKGGDWGCRTGT